MAASEIKPPDLKEEDDGRKKKKFDFEELLQRYRVPISIFLVGLILVGFGVVYFRISGEPSEIEVLEDSTQNQEEGSEVVVEIAGAVEKAGVYRLPSGSRIEDLLIASGGFSAEADRVWIEKYINRASKLSDGQKIYIPTVNEQPLSETAKNLSGGNTTLGTQGSDVENPININTSTQKELEDLPGIGPVYAQNIIEHRPYSSVEELLSKGALKKSVYEKIKDEVSVY